MKLSFSKIHDSFKLNGNHFNPKDLKELAIDFIKDGEPYEVQIGSFLIDWLDQNEYVNVSTSGSTGTPKTIKLAKEALVNSAIATGLFFNLKPTNKALHCLPSGYIAGKMMLVRAMVLGLEIDCVNPTSKLQINNNKTYHFSAMVPLQVRNNSNAVHNIKTLIIGGSKVSKSLEAQLIESSCNSYETYGMTETVTHVAVRQLQSKFLKVQPYFKALPSIHFSQDHRQCLVINAPKITNTVVVTNDIVRLISDTSFELLGRFDNVINSGGVKLFPEQIEAKLHVILKQRFMVASIKDETLGEKLVLIIENPSEAIATISNKIKTLKTLDKFEIPKVIYALDSFVETNSGKLQRGKTLQKVLA
ncbi:AMP-binding protein [uncultured Winogradskyella sp.]|uniref:AMP-binding protein n=1 Tax=uncultured Winogradskyella sp. TaxID=395353 RepID=UPI0030D748E8